MKNLMLFIVIGSAVGLLLVGIAGKYSQARDAGDSSKTMAELQSKSASAIGESGEATALPHSKREHAQAIGDIRSGPLPAVDIRDFKGARARSARALASEPELCQNPVIIDSEFTTSGGGERDALLITAVGCVKSFATRSLLVGEDYPPAFVPEIYRNACRVDICFANQSGGREICLDIMSFEALACNALRESAVNKKLARLEFAVDKEFYDQDFKLKSVPDSYGVLALIKMGEFGLTQ